MRSARSLNLLERQGALAAPPQLSEAQIRLDASLRNFNEQACDASNLLAMSVGSFAYRFARSGLISAGLFRGASNVAALGVEVTAFRATSNVLAHARGLQPSEAVFDRRGWLTSFTHFAALKGAGYLAEGQNVFLSHTFQSLSMVGAHQLTYAFDLTTRPHGSFWERMVEAETTNIALGAGSSLMGMATGHSLHARERSLDLQAEAALHVRRSSPFFQGPEESALRMASDSRPYLSMGAHRESLSSEPLREEALNDFWKSHLENGGLAHEYLNRSPEARRLLRALHSTDQELKGREVSQRDYLDVVLKHLRNSQGITAKVYSTRYSVLEASERFDSELNHSVFASEGGVRGMARRALGWLGIRMGSEVQGLFERHLARYRVEDRGGLDWGLRVNGGKPRQALDRALQLLPCDAKGALLELHEGRSLGDRLREARQTLEAENVRLVAVWGAGRHGLALGDWVRQAAGRGEMVDGKYVIPIMLGHRPDFTHELNVDGANEKNLPGIPINEAGRLGLRAALPQENKAYLALSDSVIVTLPSTQLKSEFTPELLRQFGENTQLIFAIKSVLDKGESIPGYVMETLALAGRFDLMVNAAFQSGLGFPKEMLGRVAPDAPVNLAVDAITIEAAVRASRLLIGDRAALAQVSANKRSLYANNKRIDAGILVFKGAYGGFIKNFIAPWVGHRLMDYYVQNLPHVTPAMMRSKLANLQEEAIELSERIFRDFEAIAIRREAERVGEVTLAHQGNDHSSQKRQVLDWVEKVKQRLSQYRDRVTATEDLLGCTRIRDMDVFMRIVGDLMDAKGLTFERRFGEFPARVRSQASSGNFAYGLLDRSYLRLVDRGMIVRRPVKDFTAEGINGIPYAVARWGRQPDFVRETLAWVRPAQEPMGRPALHASGLRRHALRVTRDLVDAMEDMTHPIILNHLSAEAQRPEVQKMMELAKEMIQRLRREKQEFPPVSDEVGERIEDTLLTFERFLLDTESRLRRLDYSKEESAGSLKKHTAHFRRALLEVRSQLAGHEEWLDAEAMAKIRRHLDDALQPLNPH